MLVMLPRNTVSPSCRLTLQEVDGSFEALTGCVKNVDLSRGYGTFLSAQRLIPVSCNPHREIFTIREKDSQYADSGISGLDLLSFLSDLSVLYCGKSTISTKL